MKRASRYLLATFMMMAGTAHFLVPGFYAAIVPPELPFPVEIVYLSGALEVAFGVLLLVPRFSRVAAWGVFALLIAVFPANIYVFLKVFLPARRNDIPDTSPRLTAFAAGATGV